MPVGRPPKYDPAMCQQVIDMMASGMERTECASELGVSRSTFYRWRDDHPEFRDAIKHGEGELRAFWARKSREATLGGTFNSGYIWMTKNLFRNMDNDDHIADKVEADVSTPVDAPINITVSEVGSQS